jgi:hypothetical protein
MCYGLLMNRCRAPFTVLRFASVVASQPAHSKQVLQNDLGQPPLIRIQAVPSRAAWISSTPTWPWRPARPACGSSSKTQTCLCLRVCSSRSSSKCRREINWSSWQAASRNPAVQIAFVDHGNAYLEPRELQLGTRVRHDFIMLNCHPSTELRRKDTNFAGHVSCGELSGHLFFRWRLLWFWD